MYIWCLAWLCLKLEFTIDVFAANLYTLYLSPCPMIVIEPKTPQGHVYCEIRMVWLIFSVGLSYHLPHMFIYNEKGELESKTYTLRSSIDMIMANRG